MLWLNAALAFAITMLIFSMVTNVFVETIHRFVGMREKGLRLMLGHLFDRVIALRFPELGLDNPGAMTEKQKKLFRERREQFLELMTVNRAPAGTALKGDVERVDNSKEKDEPLFRWPWRGRRIDYLNVDGFMARLGSSEFGDAVRANAGDALNDVLKDLAQKFDAFGGEASEFFQRRARFLAIAVSIVVAWFMYVHPYEIFRNFVDDPASAAAVIAQKEGATKEFEDFLEKRAKESETKVKELEAQLKAAKPDQVKAIEIDFEEARKKWQDAKDYAANAKLRLSDAGVPVGWTNERRADAGFWEWKFLDFFKIPLPDPASSNGLRTAMWLILGGLLIGLGGPFWYDMIKSLSAIASLVGGAKGGEEKDVKKAPDGGKNTSQPQTPVEHFNAAAAGRDAATGGGASEATDDEPVG